MSRTIDLPTAPATVVSDGVAPDAAPDEVEAAISAHYQRLAPSQRRIIDTLLSDKRYAAYSAAELARELRVSESTVTRAAQALGFAGYPELKARLRDRLFGGPVADRIEASVAELGDTLGAASLRAIQDDIAALQATARELDPARLELIVEALVVARRIHIFGARGSHGLAEMLGLNLRLLRPAVHVLSQTAGDLGDQLIDLAPDELLIAISFRRLDRVTVELVRQAAGAGVTTIAITDHRANALARLATHTLVARLAPLRLLPSYASGASIVHALATVVALRLHKTAATRLQRAERAWQALDSHVPE